jgi:pimeloyl-ACP methyl ester carboxylesterase
LESEIEELVKLASNTTDSTVLKVTTAMRDRPDRSGAVSMSKVPIQYIIGKADQAVPLEMSLAQCYLAKNSQVEFLEKTGHMGMIERPVETLQTIKNFVQYCNPLCD